MKLRPITERLESFSLGEPMSGCTIWLGHRGADGYGRINVSRVPKLAHRVAYEAFVGRIPDGHELHHLCENKACVNPKHLMAVTREEHMDYRSPEVSALSLAAAHAARWRAADFWSARSATTPCRLCERFHSANYRDRMKGVAL